MIVVKRLSVLWDTFTPWYLLSISRNLHWGKEKPLGTTRYKTKAYLNITMAIRDRLSRIVGKSGSSSGSSTGSNSSSDSHSERRYNVASSTNTSSSATTTSSMPKTPRGLVRSYTSSAHSRLSKRTTAWLSTTSTSINVSPTVFHDDLNAFSPGSKKPDPKRSSKHPVKSYHPSERRLNERNLRHQEILGSFTMKFGRRRFSQSARSEISEVSPGNSRAASLDISRSSCQVLEDREGLCGDQRMMSSPMDDSADLGTISEFDSWAVGVLRMLNYEE